MENKSAQSDWMQKFHEMVNSCQVELKKTTQIGMKMLSASQYNAQLHECYESLGVLVREAIQSGKLDWSNEKVNELLGRIDQLEKEMENFENEVRDIKQSPSAE